MFDLDGVLLKDVEDKENLCQQMSEFSNALKTNNCFTGIITAGDGDEITTRLDEMENCFVISSSLNKEILMIEKLNDLRESGAIWVRWETK